MVQAAERKLKAWWDHEDQKTPCLLLTGPAAHQQPVPDTDDLERYWFNVDEGLKRAMRYISNQEYYGVALPYHWPDWGASTFAGVLGARMETIDKQTFWARPLCQTLEEVLEVDIDPANRFYRTVIEMTRRSVAMSRDHHFVAVYPMVGIADILAGLYGTVPLLTAMAEQPSGVKAALEHIKLRAIQWVPGAGRESVLQWYDLIRRILAGGKSVEVFARVDEIDDLVKNVGPRGLLICTGGVSPSQAARLLEKYPQDE
jgi:hypothetical protein